MTDRTDADHTDADRADAERYDQVVRSLLADPPGGAAYAELNAAQRAAQDALVTAALPDDVSADVTARLNEIIAIASAHAAPESRRRDSLRPDLPARGMPLLPGYRFDSGGGGRVRGRVTFTRFHLGGNGAAHGGAIPLVFDDILGMVVNHRQAGVARTAYLTTNYRQITPIDVELTFEAGLDRVEGRKRYASARLFGPAGDVLADVDALFVSLLPGQQ